MPLFADLDRLRADLDALRPLAPEQEARVLQKFRLEWNYNSNAIEGNSLTLGETRSLLLHGLTAAGKPMRDHLDIKGHNEAVHALEDFVRAERPLTEHFIREMHQVLLGEPYHTPAQTAGGQATRKLIMPGRYKTSPNNVLTATGEMFYFASPEETPGRMTDLVDWYRAEEAAPTLPPVALAAEFHYRFVRIHPFDDGNGRMSRLLMNLILLRHGYPMTVIKAADRNRYLAALSEADAGEPEPFLRFIIENVEASLRLMIRAARGESIDEPSDLDKKLALLKTLLENQKPEVISKRWADVQLNFYETLLEPWLTELIKQTAGFDFAFQRKRFSAYISYFGQIIPSYSNLIGSREAKDDILKSLRRPNATVNEIRFVIHWDAFKQKGNEFDSNLILGFIFYNSKFTVFWDVNDREVSELPKLKTDSRTEQEFLYSKECNPAEIASINLTIANKVYDFIAAKLAKADTPPA